MAATIPSPAIPPQRPFVATIHPIASWGAAVRYCVSAFAPRTGIDAEPKFLFGGKINEASLRQFVCSGNADPSVEFSGYGAGCPPAELHPELRDAITALRRANQRLQRAGGDWGGHKEDTLKATNAAIVQLQQCLPYDQAQ